MASYSFSANFPTETESYRAFRFPWSGQPDDEPAIAVERGSGEEVRLYASWNGATEVATWEVLAGPERLEPLGAAVPRQGFETAIAVDTAEAYVGSGARHLRAHRGVKPRVHKGRSPCRKTG